MSRPPARRPLRAALRFAAAVMVTSGGLLIADAGVTLAWQEPISAFTASRQQDRLERQLMRTERLYGERRAGVDVRPLAARLAKRAQRGEAVGRIELPTLDRSYVIAQGTDTATLRGAPGHYADTPLPGEGGTVGVAGHRTTFGAPFRPIDRLRPGQRVVARMPYGTFVYEVERTRIVKPDEVWVKRRVDHERLILTACHPLYSAQERIVVFAQLVRMDRA